MLKAEIMELLVDLAVANGHPFPENYRKGLHREPAYLLLARLDLQTAPEGDAKTAARKAVDAANFRAHDRTTVARQRGIRSLAARDPQYAAALALSARR